MEVGAVAGRECGRVWLLVALLEQLLVGDHGTAQEQRQLAACVPWGG